MGGRHSCSQCCEQADEWEDELGGRFIESMSALDLGPGSEPVGKVFEETLADLEVLDRQLLCFCATASLAAVRWLVHLGACMDICDANGTTCLHVACRSGALSVVCEVIRESQELDPLDTASWTPMHIAAHMGRREAVLRLLLARASPQWRNARGQTPLDLCRDMATLEVLQAPPSPAPPWGGKEADAEAAAAQQQQQRQQQPGAAHGHQVPVAAAKIVCALGGMEDDSLGMPPLDSEPECFFVNPTPAIRSTSPHRKALLHIASVIFNIRPSYGLAFAVVTGLVNSYTGAMRLILQAGGVCRVKLGCFLGDAFSLCQLTRFSVFDAMPLLHTGVVGALCCAGSVLQLPEDLQKIDRLMRALSNTWWKKHKGLVEDLAGGPYPQNHTRPGKLQCHHSNDAGNAVQRELVGLGLKQYLSGAEALCQLLLSTLLLHWFLHSNDGASAQAMSMESWLSLNRGIEAGGMDVPEHVQRRIYSEVSYGFREELVLAPPRSADGRSMLPSRVVRNALPQKTAGCARLPSAISACSSLEGAVALLGAPLSCPEVAAGEGSHERPAAHNVLGSAPDDTPRSAGGDGAEGQPHGVVWASLCSIFLFLSACRGGGEASRVPYALTDARNLRVASVCHDSQIVKLEGVLKRPEDETQKAPMKFVTLLPDGRWRETELSTLEVQVKDPGQFQSWVSHLIHNTHKFVTI